MGDIYGKSVYDELVKNSELYNDLLEENKKLKAENAELKEYKENLIWLDKKKDKEIEKLEEEKLELKSELSKFSEAYKKYRDYEKEELAESCYDLARENEKLKEEIRGLRDTQYTHGEPTVSSGGVGGQIYIL